MAEEPAALYRRYSAALVEAVDGAMVSWVARCVADRYRGWRGADAAVPLSVSAAALAAGEAARAEVIPALRALLALEVEAQPTGPLALLRAAVCYPTEVLAGAGVPGVVRDAFDERVFPDDVYGLSPAAFADLGPSVHESGLLWGAAKAHVVLTRRRARPAS